MFVDSSRVRIAGQPTKKSLRIVGAHLLQAQDLLRELEARCGAPVGSAMLKFPSLHKCISVDCEVVFLVDTLLQVLQSELFFALTQSSGAFASLFTRRLACGLWSARCWPRWRRIFCWGQGFAASCAAPTSFRSREETFAKLDRGVETTFSGGVEHAKMTD